MPIIGASIAAGMQGIQMIQSGVKQRKARLGLEELQKTPFPEITVSPEMQGAYSQAQAISKYGFSPEETAAFNQNLARSQGTAFQSAVDMSGGQLAGAIGGGLQTQKIGAINQFAAEGAGLKLKKIQYAGDIAGQIQAIKQAGEAQKIQYRLALETAYGTAQKQQAENVSQGFGNLAQLGVQTGLSVQNQRNFDADQKRLKEIGTNTTTDISPYGTSTNPYGLNFKNPNQITPDQQAQDWYNRFMGAEQRQYTD